MISIPPKESIIYEEMLQYDLDTLLKVQRSKCPHCGGSLDRADYKRKPRGLPEGLAESFLLRFALCCRNDGCRKRTKVPSVRFWNRKVYLMMFIILSCSASKRLVSEMVRQTGVSPVTLNRWRGIWANEFQTSFAWKNIKALIFPPPSSHFLPYSLLLSLMVQRMPIESALLNAMKLLSID